jgi:hypothetical protein
MVIASETKQSRLFLNEIATHLSGARNGTHAKRFLFLNRDLDAIPFLSILLKRLKVLKILFFEGG